MGSPISVVLAELTMQKIEQQIFDTLPVQILLWKRYVDDIIAIVPKSATEGILAHINGINQAIQFTCEKESNNQIPYLDL